MHFRWRKGDKVQRGVGTGGLRTLLTVGIALSPIERLCTSNTSVTRLGGFWNFLVTNYITKVAQMFWWLFGQLWKLLLIKPNRCGYFLGNFWKNLYFFLFQQSGHTGHHQRQCEHLFVLDRVPIIRRTMERINLKLKVDDVAQEVRLFWPKKRQIRTNALNRQFWPIL